MRVKRRGTVGFGDSDPHHRLTVSNPCRGPECPHSMVAVEETSWSSTNETVVQGVRPCTLDGSWSTTLKAKLVSYPHRVSCHRNSFNGPPSYLTPSAPLRPSLLLFVPLPHHIQGLPGAIGRHPGGHLKPLGGRYSMSHYISGQGQEGVC